MFSVKLLASQAKHINHYKLEDDPNAGSKHVAYLIQPYIIKDSCARRTNFLL